MPELKDANGDPIFVGESFVRVRREGAKDFRGLVTRLDVASKPDDPILKISVSTGRGWKGERLARPTDCVTTRKPRHVKEDELADAQWTVKKRSRR